jgi:hypothetical protein
MDQMIQKYRESADKKSASGNEIGAFKTNSNLLWAIITRSAYINERENALALLRVPENESVFRKASLFITNLGSGIAKYADNGLDSIHIMNLIHLCHIAWLFGDGAFGELVVQIARCPPYIDQLKRGEFWDEYLRALSCLIKHEPYDPKLPKISGIEKHWAVYLSLISDLTHQLPVTESLKLVTESFERMNRDKRIVVSGSQPDPSGQFPVKWDFRLEAIRWYAAQAYGVQF